MDFTDRVRNGVTIVENYINIKKHIQALYFW